MTSITGPNPATTTRLEFTQHRVEQPCPSNATAQYRHYFKSHQRLLDLLAKHPAMERNLQQTYATPAASKNKVYFMWDFVGRTWGHLVLIDPARPRGEAWEDVKMRAMYSQMLINDTSGQLDMMNAAAGYNDDAGITFGPEIERAADALIQAPERAGHPDA